jgi:hypothetical protein
MSVIIYTPQRTGLSFGDLVTRVKTYGYGNTDDTFIKTWINMAYQDIATRKRWTWTEATQTVSTVAATATTLVEDLSAEPAFMGRLKPNQISLSEPEYLDWMKYEQDTHRTMRTGTGQPTTWSMFGGVIYWDPIPDAVYAYVMNFWMIPFELVNDTDYAMVPPQYRNVIVEGALMEAADRDHNPQLYAQRRERYEGMIRNMIGHDWAKQSESRSRVAMPGSYGGMYDARRVR